MALNDIARRIHNASPRPVRLTLDDGTTGVFHLHSTEFFQEAFQGEGTREGDDATYRFVTSEDTESVLVGRQAPGDGGWTSLGRVVKAERVEEGDSGSGSDSAPQSDSDSDSGSGPN